MSRPSSAAAALVLLLAGCGGSDESSSTTPPPSVPAAATAPATATTPPGVPPTETAAPGAGATAPTISLDSPRDGDQFLEGSDARADFECHNATDCAAGIARKGEASYQVKDGDRLPTKPGTYRFVVAATGPGDQTVTATATYTVPDVPGNGGGGDQQLPPGTPEGGP
jgi:hypothetical protein